MFFAVKDLEQRKIAFATQFEPGKVEFLDPKIRQVTPLEVTGIAELLETLEEIRVHGELRGTMESECDLCLEPVRLPVDGKFDLSYRPARFGPERESLALDEEESDVGFYEGDGLDLADVVREQVLLTLPMQWSCRPDCQGLCPVCGQNRNEKMCSCRLERVDERWAALRNI